MKPLIVANWKCNPQNLKEAKELFGLVKKGVRNIKNVEIVICPPFVYLPIFWVSDRQKAGFYGRALGSQDCFWEAKGAFTGEVSPKMLKDLGCQYVIVGHSERRRYFAETNEIINKKIKAALRAKLKPIFCIGETKEQKKKGETPTVLKSQIVKGLEKVSKKEMKNIIIAYEPIWAIGTGKPCDVNEAQSMGLLIKKIISKIWSRSLAENLKILYGGSVNSKNASAYLKEAKMAGLLVGGASLDSAEFIEIVKSVSRA